MTMKLVTLRGNFAATGSPSRRTRYSRQLAPACSPSLISAAGATMALHAAAQGYRTVISAVAALAAGLAAGRATAA